MVLCTIKKVVYRNHKNERAAAQAQYVDAIIKGILADPDGTAAAAAKCSLSSRSLTIGNKEILPFINIKCKRIVVNIMLEWDPK